MKRRLFLFSAFVILSVTGLWLILRDRNAAREPGALTKASNAPAGSKASGPPPPGGAGTKTAAGKPAAAGPPGAQPAPELTGIEQQKEIDKQHMGKLRDGIFAYKAKYGRYPEYLSQLSPEFVPAETLVSPRKKEQRGSSILSMDHPDPGMEELSYGYEFSNLEFRDGRTFAEIKEVQRSEWGDVVPLLRFFGYDKVINMSYGGEIYETQLNWEWDAATLDVVDKIGWGPGLTEGEMVKVKVVGPDGAPVSGAQVWADGRNYSFDLPDRPFTTDAAGYATIPVGVDQDRTALSLRLQASGMTAPLTQFAAGETPAEVVLTAEATAQQVAGRLVDESGAPLADARVFLKQTTAEGQFSSGTLAQLHTDSNGYWQATLNPKDAGAISAQVALPGGNPLRFGGGVPVDAAAAAAGTAVTVVPSGR